MNSAENNLTPNQKKLLGLSYLSFGFGYGPFMPLVLAWVFRKDRFIAHQLLQSSLFQGLFYIISLLVMWGSIIYSYKHQGSSPFLTEVVLPVAKSTLDWMVKITLFVISTIVFMRGYIFIPLFNSAAAGIQKFCERKTIKRSVFLSLLWPGLGQLYLGKSWLGWIVGFGHLVVLLSVGYLLFAYLDFAFAKDFLTLLGFYVRIGDKAFLEGFVNLRLISLLAFLLLVNYSIALCNLPLWKTLLKRNNLFSANSTQRRFFGSLSFSFILHLGIMWALLLLPFILTQSANKKAVNQRAKEVYEKLKREQERLDKKLLDKKIPPNQQKDEREIEFSLELPNKIDGLNEFSNKAFGPKQIEDPINKPPNIGFSEHKKILPSKKVYLKKHTRQAKSYSEYLTAKVREGSRDRIIWDDAPYPYSLVLEYTVQPSGRIADIQVVEPSGNLKTDALVISVLQSMNPLMSPPQGKTLRVTELFWNTGGQNDLDTDLKRALAAYPDGRMIELF